MPDPVVSYYNGDLAEVKVKVQAVCHQLQINGGLLNRVPTTDLEGFFYDADRWTEEKLREFYEIPFKKARQAVPSNSGTSVHVVDYPPAVKHVALYRAAELVLRSEFFENEPNVSAAAKDLHEMVEERVLEARHRLRFNTGTRAKHPNSFMPPELAPIVNEEKERL